MFQDRRQPLEDQAPAMRRRNLLVLCTGNSARSIMAEAIFNQIGRQYFHTFSAGSRPLGQVNKLALECIEQHGLNGGLFRSKSWREFTAPDSPEIDIVLTVCDNAAREVCPQFSGTVLQVHWGLPDPAGVAGGIEQARSAFLECFDTILLRVKALTSVPLERYSTEKIASLMQQFAQGTDFETHHRCI
ncbi:MAG: arsenate reductase ArsC [Candidatus Thiodiazotropha sp.]|jgi:arsenate reductase (thioredoxin)